MEIASILQENGMKEREVQVYLALLELGQASAYQIGNKTELNRPTVYATLETLINQGLVDRVLNVKKQLFIAKDPRDFVSDVQERAQKMEEALPHLLAMTELKSKPNILYFEGLEGYHRLVEYGRKRIAGKELLAYYAYSPDRATMPKSFLRAVSDRFEQMSEDGVHIRGIVPDDPETVASITDLFTEFGWELRALPLEKYAVTPSLQFTEGYIEYISRQQGQHIIIENKDIAEFHRQSFNLHWDMIEPFARNVVEKPTKKK